MATEGHHHEVKSSLQRTGIGLPENKRLVSLYPKENDILLFDLGENRGNTEAGSRGERQ